MAGYADILDSVTWDGESMSVHLPEEWGQGRTIFGGLTSGLALRALQQMVDGDRPLRSMQTAFIAPIWPGESTVSTRVLRKGRNVTHAEATILQNDSICSTLLVSYGAERDSPLALDSTSMPDMRPPEELISFPFIPGLSPDFSRYIDYRWTPDSVPYLGKGNGTASGYVRLREGGPVRSDHFALLIDAWPSPVLAMLTEPTPISSLSWSMELIHRQVHCEADSWWAIRATVEAINAGYVHGSLLMWTPDGMLVARSHQIVSIYMRHKR